ncbi:MAG: cytochrome c biogenesis protein CcsA [Pseudomonadales bacterium]|nr:cytochrome c biogenesis protein CcsA [Pseudomonadales bacterium]
MNPLYFGIISASTYIGATIYLASQLRHHTEVNKTILIGSGVFAFFFHAVSAYGVIKTPEGIYFSFFQVASLFGWVIAAVAIIASFYRPVSNLALLAYPSAAMGILLSLTIKTDTSPLPALSPEILLHIILSILAYSVLAIAVAQSLLLYAQHYQLKHKHMTGLIQFLPPLQTMEKLLFEMIWAGIALLSISIGSGFLFLENLFSQHLVHKTTLSIAAWLTFAVLLWGRHKLGWRGKTAIKGTLIGFSLLVLAYFGSKLVLEIILQRS